MKDEYVTWIKAYIDRMDGKLLGRCKDAVEEMAKAFPELTKVPGHVYTDWGMRGHWWCKTADGEVIDPTAKQFGFIFAYEPWVPGTEVRVGKCMECGDEIWKAVQTLEEEPRRETFCSKDCEATFCADQGC